MQSLKVRSVVLVAALAVSLAAVLFARSTTPESTMSAPRNAMNVPDWELKDVDGKTVRSSDFKGKVVILDFWATWCGPCRAEIPGLVALQKEYGAQGLAVVGASLDDGGAAAVKQFTEKLGVNYPVVLADEKLQAAFGGIEATPTTFIIDRTGRVVKEQVGFADQDEFEQEIKPLLKP